MGLFPVLGFLLTGIHDTQQINSSNVFQGTVAFVQGCQDKISLHGQHCETLLCTKMKITTQVGFVGWSFAHGHNHGGVPAKKQTKNQQKRTSMYCLG
jgi:hypothetical protein